MQNIFKRLSNFRLYRLNSLDPFWVKSTLIRLNQDIDLIMGRCTPWDDHPPLTDIEFFVLIIEDGRFFMHNGIDIISIFREILKMIALRKFGGASTIEMQLVRTITNKYDRTFSRKLYEMTLSILIQFHLSKIAILRSYLRIAYMGTGIRGARKASRIIFNQHPSDVLGLRAATIASLLVTPLPKRPSQNWRIRIQRRASKALSKSPLFEKRFYKIGVR